jgi:hypothetical protein
MMASPTSPLTNSRGFQGAGLLAGALLLVAACDYTPNKPGVPGETGLAMFSADTPLVFGNRLLVGSAFELSALARRAADESDVLAATFVSRDEEVFVVSETELEEPAEGDESGHARVLTTVSMVGTGEAYLELMKGGEALDRILLKAAEAKAADLLDLKILGSSVDARPPQTFGIVDRGPVALALGASDQCGGALLALSGATLRAVEPNTPADDDPVPSSWLSVDPGVAGSFELSGSLDNDSPLVPRRAALLLEVPGLLAAQRYEVHVIPAASVDDVRAEVAAAQEGQAEIWGRAFADEIEVVGLDFNWSATPRVALGRREGPNVLANVYFPEGEEPPDERPAKVTAKVFGEEGTVDLFTVTGNDLITRRVPGPAPAEPGAAAGPSCGGGGEACNPYGAALGGLFLATLRLSRRRRFS